MPGRPKYTFEQTVRAFWLRVDCRGPRECWNWIGWIQKEGYGKFSVSKTKTVLPHRFAWQISKGEIPKGLLVCHHCDNKRCCNPLHLFLGTHKDNSQDAVRKGRTLKGIRNAMCKLTDDEVSQIRSRYRKSRGVNALASEFRIHPNYVWAVANRKSRA